MILMKILVIINLNLSIINNKKINIYIRKKMKKNIKGATNFFLIAFKKD